MKGNQMKRTLAVASTAFALVSQVAVAERSPSAYHDSSPASIDTRTGTMLAVESQTLDSRTGSWFESDFRGLDTTSPGISIIVF